MEEIHMKKIIPFLVISILVLSSFGVVAITREKSEVLNTESPRPGFVRILIKGGLGFTAIIISSTHIENTGCIFISI
jgi:hypothetical protein